MQLNVIEKEIKKLLKKMEYNQGIYHLTPAEIQNIKNKRGLLTFLKNPKGKYVVWKFRGCVDYDLHSDDSLHKFEGDVTDYIKLRFTGKWYKR